jgi:hypothetical protein
MLLVSSGGTAFYFYDKYIEMKGEVDAKKQETQEIKELVEKVRRLVELPEGEVPTIATVSDKEKLIKGWFFERAENGDKVLIFEGVNRAVLYRPQTNKIVEIGPVTADQKKEVVSDLSGSNKTLETLSKNLRVAVYNGTERGGLTDQLILEEGYEIVYKEKAIRSDYTEIMVVGVSDLGKEKAFELARSLGAITPDSLPEEEILPSNLNADVVIILGSQYLP